MAERITSRTNPLMTHIRKLASSRSYREKTGEYLGDGVKLLEEAVLEEQGGKKPVVTECAAFAQRRKTALNALSSATGIGKGKLAEAFAAAGVDPTVRAERLTLAQFAALSDAVGEQAGENGGKG